MDINGFVGLNNSKDLVNTNPNIKGNKVSNLKELQLAAKLLQDGEVVKGEIIDVKNLIATIKSDTGIIFTGQLQNPTQVSIGDIREFMVKQENNVTLASMLPISDEEVLENNINKVLKDSGIDETEKNVVILKELVKNQLPITKENITALNRAMQMGKEDGLEKGLFLLKNEIPINNKNMESVENLISKESNTTKDIILVENLMEEMPEGALKDELIKALGNSEKETGKLLDKIVNEINVKASDTKENVSKEIMPKEILQNAKAETIIINEKDLKNIIDNNFLGKDFEKTVADSIFKLLKDNAIKNEKGEIIAFPKDILEKAVKDNVEKRILSSGIGDVVEKLKFSPKGKDPQEIDEFLNTTREKIDKSLEVLKEYKGESQEKFVTVLESFKEKLEFSQYIKNNIYFQMPLNINSHSTNGELIVFADKKNKKNNKSSVSALVSIQTENIGQFETFVQKNSKNLNIQFRLEDEKIISLVKSNLPKLVDVLKGYGYNIENVIYKELEEPFNIAKDEEPFKQKNNAYDAQRSHKRISFDVKM